MHIQDGELKAYLDEQLDEGQHSAVREHLSACAVCEQRAHELAQRSAFAAGRLEMSAALSAGRLRKREARDQIDARLSEKETSMLKRLFSRQFRLAWGAALVVLLLAAALAFPPLQAIANDFLGLFRVKQFTVVQVNPAGLPEQLGSSGTLESMFTNNLKFETGGEPQEVSGKADASTAAGFKVRLPLRAGSAPQVTVNPGGKISFDVDLDLARAVLQEIGRSDLELPDNLDGALIQVDVPVSVSAEYGACQPDLRAARQEGYDPDDPLAPFARGCTTLIQMPSPGVTAPPNLDLDRLAQVFLQVLGMSEEDAAHFAASVDWTTTLVLPVPAFGTSYQDVLVDGVSGTLIQQAYDDHPSQYLLLWVKDDIVYALTGPGSETTALQIAGSME